MKTALIAALVGAGLVALLIGTPASASPGSGQGARTDVVGTFRLVHADGTPGPFRIATVEQGPEGEGIVLARGERVEVVSGSCLDPVTQTRHAAEPDHFAWCESGSPAVPASWAR